MSFPTSRSEFSAKWFRGALIGAGVLAASALVVRFLAQNAERNHRQTGKVLRLDGHPLHYLEQGSGRPVVLLHGNGSMLEEIQSSGLLHGLSKDYRVIALDRPGFGTTPRAQRRWTPEDEADLTLSFLRELGAERPVVVAHSWSTLIALSMAIKDPGALSGVVLVGGYYFPTWRADVALHRLVAMPIFGDLLRHTLWPLIARASAPLVFKRIFSPRDPTADFLSSYSVEMATRPSQLTAIADDTVEMPKAAARLCQRYGEIQIPVDIVAGIEDKMVSTEHQSRRLHRELHNSYIDEVPAVGHMIHHAYPELIERRVAHVFERASQPIGTGAHAEARRPL